MPHRTKFRSTIPLHIFSLFPAMICNLKWVTVLKMRPFLFVGLRYLSIWKIEIWKKTKKLVWKQIGEKFSNGGILLCPWKNVMLVVCQILNICKYEVLFDQKRVTCKYYLSRKLCYFTIYFTMSFFFFFSFFFVIADLKNFTWCNVIQQIKKVSPNIF